VILIAFSLLALLDVNVKSVVAKPGLILRNEGHAPIAVSYFLEQMESTPSTSIAWAGSSLLQGINCTTPETTAPHLVERLLRNQDYDVRSFNLAHAGNVVADNFSLAHAALNHDADMVVFELVFGLFMGRGKGIQNAKHDFVYYTRDLKDFRYVRKNLLLVSKKSWGKSLPYLWVKNHWALLRHRGILMQHYFGRHEDLATQLGDKLMRAAQMDVVRHGHSVYEDLPTKRNVDYYWKQMDENFIAAASKGFQAKLSKLRPNPTDPKMRMIARTCAEARKKKTPILFYLAPINRQILDEHVNMPWDKYDKYRQTIRAVLNVAGCDLTDLTDTIPSQYFTDSQHLNINGHYLFAKALADPIKEKLGLGSVEQ
jgi:hypothetical protein